MRALFVTFLFAAAFWSGTGFAQIVNVHNRFLDSSEEGLHGALEASVDWRTGSNDYLTLKAGGGLKGAWGRNVLLGLVEGETGQVEGTRTLNRTLEHVRHRYHFSDVVASEAFLQHEFNEFRRLQLRVLLGAGPRFQVVRGERGGLAVGVALMLERERLRDDAEASDAQRLVTEYRASSYLLGNVRVMEGFSIVQTVFLQPRLSSPSDFRAMSDTSLVAQANERLSMTVGFVAFYEASPPVGVEKLDTQLRSAIGWRF